MNDEEVRMKTWFSVTSSYWIRLLESDARWFIASIFKHSIFWEKFPDVIQAPVHKEA